MDTSVSKSNRHRFFLTLRAMGRLFSVVRCLVWQAYALRRIKAPKLKARKAHEVGRILLGATKINVIVEGQVPREGTLVVPNHRSYLDTVVMGGLLPCAFLAKIEMRDWPVFGPFSRHINTIYVNRDSKPSRRAARGGIATTLKGGLSCVVFAEGTTTQAPGCHDFRWGSFEVAAAINAPVCPVAIEYKLVEDAWIDDDDFLAHFIDRMGEPTLEVHVRFGPTIRWMDPRAMHSYCENWVRGALADLHLKLHSPNQSDSGGSHVPPAIPLSVSVPSRSVSSG